MTRPIFFAHFFDLARPRLFWFTNLLWWGMGPALEIAAMVGVVWLITRGNKRAILAAVVPLVYFATASNPVAPFIRYAIPLVTTLTVAAGVLTADLLRAPRFRFAGAVVTLVVLGSTIGYAAAYTNIFRQPDSRVEAARYLRQAVPYGSKVLVEPSHNIPPIGSYFYSTNFYGDYVLWGAYAERFDWLRLYGLDTYRFL